MENTTWHAIKGEYINEHKYQELLQEIGLLDAIVNQTQTNLGAPSITLTSCFQTSFVMVIRFCALFKIILVS